MSFYEATIINIKANIEEWTLFDGLLKCPKINFSLALRNGLHLEQMGIFMPTSLFIGSLQRMCLRLEQMGYLMA